MSRLLSLVALLGVSTLGAQTPPRPAQAPAPARRPVPAPRPAPAPRVWDIEFPDAMEIERIREEALHSVDIEGVRARASEEARLSSEQWRAEAEAQRDRWRVEAGLQRDQWRYDADLGRRIWEESWHALEQQGDFPPLAPMAPMAPLSPLAPLAPLAPGAGDPPGFYLGGGQGDTLYRRARELLNSGEYRRAAAAFRDVLSRSPNSSYAADALYWQAFALYRIGGATELRSAIAALDEQRAKFPGTRMQSESEALTVRIRGALAARGDASAAALIRTTAADSMLRCDREEQMVRVEALSALVRSDAQGALPLLQKTLARKDGCSAPLRRTAVFLLGSSARDGSAVTTLSQVARTDPSTDVRAAAMEWLARSPGDDALATLEDLARDTSDRIQRTAVRALVSHPSPKARQFVRSIIERAETPERLRLEALSAFDRERTTADDVTWMRALYTRTENPRIRSRLVSTLSNVGGPDVEQWLLTLARDQDTDSDTRRGALRRVGRSLPIAELAKLYDASAERPIRESLIDTFGQRTEAEATDKLLDIVKAGTDPQLRSRAISALTSKKDPRALRLLMEIIDK